MKTMPVLKFSNLGPEMDDLLTRMFGCRNGGLMEINPGGVILPYLYKTIGQDILDMKVRESDVWLCSYPRTGSTWAQEMVWLIGNDLDYEGSQKSLHQIRCPRLEMSCVQHKLKLESDTSVDLVKGLPNRRYVRTHLPWDLLPVDIENVNGSFKPKIIYTYRNPKDVVVSYYHYCTLVHKLNGTFEEFCDLFLRDRVPFSPYWNHLLGIHAMLSAYLKFTNTLNICLFKYISRARHAI